MVLITGASGFIGSHLVEALYAQGCPVRCLVRPASVRANLPPVDFAIGDLARGDGLDAALEGVDSVIHLAGVTKAVRAAGYHAGNVQASENLARAAAGRGIRVVHVSSLAAAGPSANGEEITENTQPRPVSQYGRSKLEAERAVRAHVPDAIIVRPPVVYGPRDTGVLEMFKPLARGIALQIAGGERWFSIVYVKDLVRGILSALGNPQAAGQTYFLANARAISWSELIAAAGKILSRQTRVIRIPQIAAQAVGCAGDLAALLTGKPTIVSRDKIREARCRYWTCDSGKAARELNFRAETPLDDGLRETLTWYKEAGWLQF